MFEASRLRSELFGSLDFRNFGSEKGAGPTHPTQRMRDVASLVFRVYISIVRRHSAPIVSTNACGQMWLCALRLGPSKRNPENGHIQSLLWQPFPNFRESQTKRQPQSVDPQIISGVQVASAVPEGFMAIGWPRQSNKLELHSQCSIQPKSCLLHNQHPEALTCVSCTCPAWDS